MQRLQAHPSLRFQQAKAFISAVMTRSTLEGFLESNDDNIDLCEVVRGIHGINSIVNRVMTAHPAASISPRRVELYVGTMIEHQRNKPGEFIAGLVCISFLSESRELLAYFLGASVLSLPLRSAFLYWRNPLSSLRDHFQLSSGEQFDKRVPALRQPFPVGPLSK